MYVLYIFGLRVCDTNTLLRRTTAIRGGSDTLSIYFGVVTMQIHRIFSKGQLHKSYIKQYNLLHYEAV